MRIYFLLIVLFIISDILFISCLGDKTKMVVSNSIGPIFDKNIGLTEDEIMHKYGEPDEVIVMSAKKLLKDELRSHVRTKIQSKDQEIEIKELVYKLENKVLFFWLLYATDHNWRAVSDVEVPEGVQF